MELTETALLAPFRVPGLGKTSCSLSDSRFSGYKLGKHDGGHIGSGGRGSRIVLTLVDVVCPFFVQPRLVVFTLTIVSAGVPLIVVTL